MRFPKKKTSGEPDNILTIPGLQNAGWPAFFGIAIILVGILAFPVAFDVRFYFVQVGILIMFYATLGTAWGIVGGYAGQHSIGQAAFVGIGAYTSTLLYMKLNISPWIGLFAGMLLAAFVAVIIGYPLFRYGLKGDYFALGTVALGLIIFELTNSFSSFTGGSQGIPLKYEENPLNFQFPNRTVYYYIIFVIWLATVITSYKLRRSRAGFEMLAVRDDEIAAARGGISVLKAKLTAFVLAGVISAAAGTFFAQFILFLDPGTVMSLAISVQIILVAVLGGMNSYLGGTLGAIILIPVSQLLASTFTERPGTDLALYGVILIILMLFMPNGILGLFRKSPKWRKIVGW
jgi:branched-chain amino acid transport system permease protein